MRFLTPGKKGFEMIVFLILQHPLKKDVVRCDIKY